MNELNSQPLVSVTTPVYNGEEYLRECIESVLAQSYENWEFVILNNCSTDGTLDIVRGYASRDSRIRVYSNDQFLPVINNHNKALGLTSGNSIYCKPLMADDWLFPDCLREMVRVAKSHLSIGLVSSYSLSGKRLILDGLPYPSTFLSGRKVCHDRLLGAPYVFGTPTNVLIRADLIRKHQPFYNEGNLHADLESCFEILQYSDFGFVHQVLTFSRVHEKSQTYAVRNLDSILLANLAAAVKFGSVYLTEQELERSLQSWFRLYYRMLAVNSLRLREPRFWQYHKHMLEQIGYALDRRKLARSVLAELVDRFLRPLRSLGEITSWWPDAIRRALGRPSSEEARFYEGLIDAKGLHDITP